MSNFLSGLWNTIKDSAWDQPMDIAKNVAKGDLGGAFDEFKGTFGENNRNLQDVFQGAGIGGWVGDHPQESIGAAVGTILGGWLAAPAAGAGTAAGATGAGTAAAAGTSAMAYAPTASTVLGGTGSAGTAAGLGTWGTGATSGLLGTGTGTAGFGGGLGMTYAPTASAVLSPAAGASSGLTGSTAAEGLDVQQLIQGMNKLNQATDQSQQEKAPEMVQAPTRKGGGMNPILANSNANVKAANNVATILQNNPFNRRK